jgi:hypothetical protein
LARSLVSLHTQPVYEVSTNTLQAVL